MGQKTIKGFLQLLEKYSNTGDIVLDPFSGYGVFICEAYLNDRNAIGNHLNPSSVFIQKQLLNTEIDIDLFKKEIDLILDECNELSNYFYTDTCPKCGSL